MYHLCENKSILLLLKNKKYWFLYNKSYAYYVWLKLLQAFQSYGGMELLYTYLHSTHKHTHTHITIYLYIIIFRYGKINNINSLILLVQKPYSFQDIEIIMNI